MFLTSYINPRLSTLKSITLLSCLTILKVLILITDLLLGVDGAHIRWLLALLSYNQIIKRRLKDFAIVSMRFPNESLANYFYSVFNESLTFIGCFI